jgi:hypothetical protein
MIISTDLDVGSPKLGKINHGERDHDVNFTSTEQQIGAVEELAVPVFLDFFDELQIPMTIGIRGQLSETDSPLIDTVLKGEIKHDVGAHGYSHKVFTNLHSFPTRRSSDLRPRT